MFQWKRTLPVIVCIIFVVMMFSSCSSDSGKEEKPTAAKLLNQALELTDNMERENNDLRARVEGFSRISIVEENKRIEKVLEDEKNENTELREQVRRLKGAVMHGEMQLKAREKGPHDAAGSDQSAGLKEEISKLKGLLSYSDLQLQRARKQAADFSKENRALKDVIARIGAVAGPDNAAKKTAEPDGN